MGRLIKIVTGILLVIFVVALSGRIISYSKEYTTPFDPAYWKMRYEKSQWTGNYCADLDPHVNPYTCQWDDPWFEKHKNDPTVLSLKKSSIGDDGLYTHAGWEYIHGSNPTLLNAEIPPLGKYLIGVGEVVFRNQNILILIIGLSCLLLLYLLNIEIFKNESSRASARGSFFSSLSSENKILAFLPVLLFSLEPVFYEQLRAPYLDTTYLLFLLLSLLFTLKEKYILASIFLGCFAAIKYPALSLFLLVPMLLWVFLFDKKNIKKFILSLILYPLVFLLSYTAFFIHGGGILEFLKTQKWILVFYSSGVKAAPGIVYPMILSGNWNTWTNGIQKMHEWNILWPASFTASTIVIIFFAYNIKNKKNKAEDKKLVLMIFWTISYLAFLSFVPVYPRYLLLLLPFMYNLLVWFLVKFVFRRF